VDLSGFESSNPKWILGLCLSTLVLHIPPQISSGFQSGCEWTTQLHLQFAVEVDLKFQVALGSVSLYSPYQMSCATTSTPVFLPTHGGDRRYKTKDRKIDAFGVARLLFFLPFFCIVFHRVIFLEFSRVMERLHPFVFRMIFRAILLSLPPPIQIC